MTDYITTTQAASILGTNITKARERLKRAKIQKVRGAGTSLFWNKDQVMKLATGERLMTFEGIVMYRPWTPEGLKELQQ